MTTNQKLRKEKEEQTIEGMKAQTKLQIAQADAAEIQTKLLEKDLEISKRPPHADVYI